MRKLIGTGLAALLLVAAIPSHADALGGRGRSRGRSARASSGANGGPKRGKGAKSAKAPKSGGLALGKIPKGAVPKLKTSGGGGGGGSGVAGRRRVVAGTKDRATNAPAKIAVNYNKDADKPVPKLVNGGLAGGDASVGSADVGGGGHHRGGGGGKKKRG